MLCVYCLDNRALRDEQILVRGEDLYLCAPRGQLVEGCLAIVPYRCIGCVAMMPDRSLSEMAGFVDLVAEFYVEVYGITDPVLYEQGRAGGGAVAADEAGFPMHAHVCCFPVAADVHGLLKEAYLQKPLSGVHELAAATAGSPYVYVDTAGRRVAYLPRDEESRAALTQMRLKPALAKLIGFPERGYWRDYPGDAELQWLIQRFATFRESRVT